MAAKSHLWIVLFLLCCRPVFVRAQTDPNSWDKLNLNSTTIAGTKVYYEKSFEPNLPFFETMYKEFLAEKDNRNEYASKKDQILADINSLLGIDEPDIEFQDKAWTEFLGAFSSIEMTTIYIVKQSTTKDFLRAGGELPNFTYNKDTDMVAYNPNFAYSSKDKREKNFEFAFPISSNENFEKETNIIFKILQDLFSKSGVDLAIHEIVEMSLLKKARPTDPYWRWFSDGVANAMTCELLKKHAGTEYAEGFIKDYDVNDYVELQKELNLRYWLTGRFCILIGDMPTEKGQKFNLARYAYATFEARRLIDEHGIDCVHTILDEISAKQSRTGRDLIETIKNVIGEDMNARLNAYQSFSNANEGRKKYITAFNKVSGKQDYEKMLFNLLRGHELIFCLSEDNKDYLNEYRYAANCLFKMGYEQQADTVMTNFIDIISIPNLKNGREAGLEAFAIYAIESGKPVKAQKFAEELLKTKPDNLTALTIQMLVCVEEKQFSQAKELAKKILSLSKNEKFISNQIAVQVLAIDPNQPESEN